MATTISTQDIVNAKRDIDDIGKAVNEKVIVSPRYGGDFKSLPMIAAEAQATIGDWETAISLITQEGGVPALAVSDASGATQQAVNDANKAEMALRFPIFSVKAFGAKGDGVADDRAAIQAAIDAASAAGAGTVYFDAVDDPSTGYYAIKSTNPEDSTCGLLFKNLGSIYVGGNLSFFGNNYYSRVVLETPQNISALLKFSKRSNYMVFDQAYFDANNKADHAFKANDEFHPYMTIAKTKFRRGLVSAASISTFVSDFYKTFFENSPVGFSLHAPSITPSAPCTAITMNSCYALECADRGYEFGLLTYSSLNACASDRTKLGYYIGAAYGVTMNGCGCENVDKMLYIDSYRGFTINTMYGLTVGSLDSNNPTPYMIELVSGMNATISGFYPVPGKRYFTYKLGSTSSRYGSENITVTDRSIERHEVYFVPTYNFARPVKLLRGDSTGVDRVYNCANSSELLSALSRLNFDFSIDHKITINLTGSSYDLGSSFTLLRVSGIGELIIQGSTADRSVARVNCPIGGLNINQSNVKVRLKNLTLASTVSNGNARRLLADNSQNIVLDNVLLEKGAVNAGHAVIASNGSSVSLINNTEADGVFGIKAFQANDTSKIKMEQRAAAPATGSWAAGMSFKYINPTTHRGAFYNGTAWVDYV